MGKKVYMIPHTSHTSVEAESGFMAGSVVNRDEIEEPTVNIENQEVGAESNYFDNPDSGWDY